MKPLIGPATYELYLKMEVKNLNNMIMSSQVAVVRINVSAATFNL